MQTSDLKTISADEYRTWFETYSTTLQNRTPFHQPAWLEAVSKGLGVEVVFVGCYTGTDLEAVVPGFLMRRGPFRLFGSPLRGTHTGYLGPLTRTPPAADGLVTLIEAVSRFARQRWRAQYTEFALREPPADQQPSLGLGWEQRQPSSYCLDLRRGEEALWKGMKSRSRGHIRKSEQLGVRIVPFTDARMYYQMLDDTYGRRGISSWHPERFFRVLLEQLIPQNLLWAWGAEYEGRIIAAGLFFHDDHEVHYFSGASLSQYRSIPASNLVQWHAIQTAVRAGLDVYNFGSRGGNSSIDHFKESFNPALVDNLSLYWTPRHVQYARQVFLASQPHMRRAQRWLKRAQTGLGTRLVRGIRGAHVQSGITTEHEARD